MKGIEIREASIQRAFIIGAFIAMSIQTAIAVPDPLEWEAEQRIVDHPDTSFLDWTGGTMMGDANVRDCLHVLWRDEMFSSSSCPVAPDHCWSAVHQIGGVEESPPWGPWGSTGSTGICSVSGPNQNAPGHDNAANIAIDGIGRVHSVWEEKGGSPLAIAYRSRATISGIQGDCPDIQSSVTDGNCSSIGWDANATDIGDPNVGCGNSTLHLYHPVAGGSGPDSSILHVFFESGEPRYRYRVLGRDVLTSQADWTMQTWAPSEAQVIATDTQLPDAKFVVGEADRNTGDVYVAISQKVGDLPDRWILRFGEKDARGTSWAIESAALGEGFPWTLDLIADIAITASGDVCVAWSEDRYSDDCIPGIGGPECDEPIQQRCVLRVKDSSTGTWSDPVYFTSPDLLWNETSPPNQSGACTVDNRGDQIHVAWAQTEGSTRMVRHRYLQASGDPEDEDDWSEAQTVNSVTGGHSDARLPKLYIDDDGERVYVAWTDRRHCCPNTEIYLRWHDENEDPSTGVQQLEPISETSRPSLGRFAPSPFAGETRSTFTIPQTLGARGGQTTIAVHDVRGARVRTLLNGPLAPGEYEVEWDGTGNGGRSVASGVYFVSVHVMGFERLVRKIVLAR